MQPNRMRLSRSCLACVGLLSVAILSNAQEAPPNQDTFYIANARSITGKQRFLWVVYGTVGPKNLATSVFTAAIQTAQNRPEEYGPHWDGYGKRFGLRLTGVVSERLMEAGLGALWDE